jgi:hypothetical protein
VATPAEAAHRRRLEQRLLELWRHPDGSEIYGFELDSELNAVKAWEYGQLRLLDEPWPDIHT